MTLPPACLAVSPGAAGAGLERWLAGLASAGWPAVVLREPASPDVAALWRLAASAVPTVILHAATPGAAALAAREGLPLHVPAWWPNPAGGRWAASVHDEAEADQRLAAGASWVVWAPVWAPTSKPESRRPLGPERFLAYAAGRPVWALGGITAARAATLRRGGAAGIAVLGGLGSAGEHAGSILAAWHAG